MGNINTFLKLYFFTPPREAKPVYSSLIFFLFPTQFLLLLTRPLPQACESAQKDVPRAPREEGQVSAKDEETAALVKPR